MRVFRIMSKKELSLLKKGKVISGRCSNVYSDAVNEICFGKVPTKSEKHFYKTNSFIQTDFEQIYGELRWDHHQRFDQNVLVIFEINRKELRKGVGFYGNVEEPRIVDEYYMTKYSLHCARILAIKSVTAFGKYSTMFEDLFCPNAAMEFICRYSQ